MEFSAVDTIWVLLGAVLVFFMQAGFAMVETGFTRAKNAGNIIMKNLMDFSLGTLLYWFVGFGIMFGSSNAFFGGFDFFIQGDYSSTIPTEAFVIFQTVFCATAATIVSGAMAERTKFSSYCIYSMILSAVVYPISGHWIWGDGFLAQMGFHDFAGSTAVHMVGGVAALIGAKVLGPRIGKFDENGNPKAIAGHNLTLGALGVFILWFCWFGFNGGSTVSMTGADIQGAASIFMTTNIAAAAAAVTVMIITWVKYKKPDVSMTLNGALAGLVGITAGCDIVSNTGAFFIGIIAGFSVFYGIEFVEKVLKIDDPVGAVGVHGVCGAVGTILVGFFALDGGLLYGGGASLLTTQLIGVACVIAWVATTMSIVFITIKNTVGLRVSRHEEEHGLDIEEHGLATSYAGFIQADGIVPPTIDVSISANVDENKYSQVTIIANKERFKNLKAGLDTIGITGMTVTEVSGCGMQKGSTEFYRGTKLETTLLPKIKVDVVVCKVPVDLIVKTVTEAIYTGNVGDGKIFISNIEDVVRISTGETGYNALQDV